MKKAMAVALFAAITFCIGCSKYEEGPRVSLLTKKQRITGNYEVESWEHNGEEAAVDLDDIRIEFLKDNTIKVEYEEEGQTITERGEWSFVSNKEQFRVEWDYGVIDYMEILKLTNKELWFIDGDSAEAHLVKR